LTDVAPGQARPEKAGERAERDEVTGPLCRAYAASRGSPGGARRDLQDLAAAINHHAKKGLHRGIVRVVLPERGEARQRWLEQRDEFARLLWTCWRTREVQNGRETAKRPLRHLCRFLILALYTGSRPGAVFAASWERAPGRSWVDVENGVFHRHSQGRAETNKRQPTVRLAPGLLAHLRRWKRIDAAKGKPHVVTHDGQPFSSDAGTALDRACKLAGIERVTAYTFRHTCASWLVRKGLPTRMVAEFLGTSEAMILKHYGHLAPDYQDEAARAIGRK
jgi:integrase